LGHAGSLMSLAATPRGGGSPASGAGKAGPAAEQVAAVTEGGARRLRACGAARKGPTSSGPPQRFMPGHGGCEPREQPPCQAALSAPRARASEGVSRGVRGRAPRARRAPRPRASATGESTSGESTGATRGVAHEGSGGEDEQLKEGRSARRARCRRARRRRRRERRGDVIASHISAPGRRPEPRKGEEAEGRPLRGEDVGPRSRPGRSRSRRSRSRRFFPGRSLGPALARRGGVAWSEEQSDEGARTAAARGARMPRQCQRLQLPRPKAAVVPGATFARAEGVPEDRKAP